MTKQFRNAVLALGALAMATSATQAHAQFGGLIRDATRGAEKATTGCGEGKSGDAARGAIGGILGGIGRRTARDAGVSSYVPVAQFSDTLTTEIACKLDEKEQAQAAEATLTATRGGGEDGTEGPPVGQSASWTSGTRKDVQGSSTVTSREEGDGEEDCIIVTDVIIVEGEETRAEKRMCRPPGKARYSIVA